MSSIVLSNLRFLLILTLAVQIYSQSEPSQPDLLWREKKNGPVNVLYCYLATQGIEASYSSLLSTYKALPVSRFDARVMCEFATGAGASLRPVSLTMNELENSPLPIIVHVDGRTPDDGAFLLVFNITGDEIDFLNGPTASIHKVDRATFRRLWSGVALVAAPPLLDVAGHLLLGVLSGLPATALIVFLLRRLHRNCKDVQIARLIESTIKCSLVRETSRFYSVSGASRRRPTSLAGLALLFGLSVIDLGALGAEPQVLSAEESSIAAIQAGLSNQVMQLTSFQMEYLEEKAGIVPQDYGGPTAYSEYFAGRKFYQRRVDTLPGKAGFWRKQQWIHEDSYDGTIFYFGDPNRGDDGDNPATVAKYLVADETDPDRKNSMFKFPYLWASGFYVPDNLADLKEHYVDSLLLRYITKGATPVTRMVGALVQLQVEIPDPAAGQEFDVDGQIRLLLSGRNSPEFVEKEIKALEARRLSQRRKTVSFLLDPNRQYSVLERQEATPDGKRILNIKTDRWEKYGPKELWLPRKCVAEYYANPFVLDEFSEEPITTVTYTLKRFEFGVPANPTFALKYTQPGTFVRDRTSEEARSSTNHEVSFTVSADGRLLREAASSVRNQIGGRGLGMQFVAVNILLIVGFIVALVYSAKRRTAGKPK